MSPLIRLTFRVGKRASQIHIQFSDLEVVMSATQVDSSRNSALEGHDLII
jgi:hypothetical protein